MAKSNFTSESVTRGHPDKLCDQIADSILDEVLRQDPESHVACEVTCATDQVHIFGEITSSAHVDYESIARQVITEVGYTQPGHGFDAESCRVTVDLHEQSPDIARGVRRVSKNEELDDGAGDQGMIFGFACKQTDFYMPLPIELAHALTKRLELVRRNGELPFLLPDGKSQVTVEYENDVPKRIGAVVLSAQHDKDISTNELRDSILSHVILPALAADSGLTGRKLIVDTYGGYARHGGGAFSGKDASKVDRSGAYMARYMAKNVVAAGLAEKCEIQLSYAIGLSEPTSILVDCFGTGRLDDQIIQAILISRVDPRPAAIIRQFDLKSPNFSKVSCYGHFGSNAAEMPWEKTDLAEMLIR